MPKILTTAGWSDNTHYLHWADRPWEIFTLFWWWTPMFFIDSPHQFQLKISWSLTLWSNYSTSIWIVIVKHFEDSIYLQQLIRGDRELLLWVKDWGRECSEKERWEKSILEIWKWEWEPYIPGHGTGITAHPCTELHNAHMSFTSWDFDGQGLLVTLWWSFCRLLHANLPWIKLIKFF